MATSSSLSQFSAVKNSSERLFVAGLMNNPSHVNIYFLFFIFFVSIDFLMYLTLPARWRDWG